MSKQNRKNRKRSIGSTESDETSEEETKDLKEAKDLKEKRSQKKIRKETETSEEDSDEQTAEQRILADDEYVGSPYRDSDKEYSDDEEVLTCRSEETVDYEEEAAKTAETLKWTKEELGRKSKQNEKLEKKNAELKDLDHRTRNLARRRKNSLQWLHTDEEDGCDEVISQLKEQLIKAKTDALLSKEAAKTHSANWEDSTVTENDTDETVVGWEEDEHGMPLSREEEEEDEQELPLSVEQERQPSVTSAAATLAYSDPGVLTSLRELAPILRMRDKLKSLTNAGQSVNIGDYLSLDCKCAFECFFMMQEENQKKNKEECWKMKQDDLFAMIVKQHMSSGVGDTTTLGGCIDFINSKHVLALRQKDYMTNVEALATVQATVREHFAGSDEGNQILEDKEETSTKALRKCMADLMKGVKSNAHDQEARIFGKNMVQSLEAHNPQSDIWTWDGYCRCLMKELKSQREAYVITSKNGCVAERSHGGNNSPRYSPRDGRGNG